jgi:hypothetical protein
LKFIACIHSFVIVSLVIGVSGRVWAEHYDNQTPEERPTKKKPPMSKYEKSEYISKFPPTDKNYFYTEDGDIIDKNSKHKAGGHGKKSKRHPPESAPAEETNPAPPQPKPEFKKMETDFSREPAKPAAKPPTQTDATGRAPTTPATTSPAPASGGTKSMP